jgi:hypothetical protein
MKRAVVAVMLACVLSVSAGDADARRHARTCRDGNRACDVGGVRDRECVLRLCEAAGCGCAPVGCCMPTFCVDAAHPDVEVSLLVPRGERVAAQTLEYGVGRWTLRCRTRRR